MALAIDGSAHANTTGVLTLTLTTTQANDYIIVTVLSNGGPVVSATGSSLGAFTKTTSSNTGASNNVSEIWAKFAPAPLTSEVITVVMATTTFTTADAFGVSGSNQTSLVWDAGSPVNSGSGGLANPLSLTTTTPDTMVIGHFYMPSNFNAFTPGTGYTFISNTDYSAVEYQVFSSAGAKTVDVSVTVVGCSSAVAIPLGASGTTWDPTNSPNATLSGGNLVATFNSSSFSNGALSSTGKSSGKYAFDIGVVCSNPSDNALGITQGHPPAAYYDGPTSFLFVPQSGYTMVRNNGSAVATEFTVSPPTSPYTLRVYVDLTASKVYYSVGGSYYFGGDAAAGTGGLTIPSGTFYVNGFSTAGGDQLTLNPSPTGLPAGWSAWDAGGVVDTNIIPPKGNLVLSQTAPSVVTTTILPTTAPLLVPPSLVMVRRKPWLRHRQPVDSTAFVVDTPFNPPKADLTLSTTPPNVVTTAGASITPASVGLLLNSTAPTVVTTANVAITVPAGALTLSTSVPTANASTTITVPKADLTLSQTVPAVVWTDNHPVTVPKGNLTLTQTAPASVMDARPVSIKGDLTLSTTPPVVVWTNNVNIIPLKGSLALSQAAPSVATTAHVAVSPAAASLTLSQTAPTVSAGASVNISPASVTLLLNENAPVVAVTAHWAITPASVSLSLNETAPTVAQTLHAFVTPPSVTLTLSTGVPGVQAGNSYSIVPAKQSLTLTTSAPAVAVTAHIAVVPPKASLTLTQTAPAVGFNWNISPAKGSLTLTQSAPTVGGVTVLAPAAAALTLTTTAPLVAVPISITVPKADLVLTGTPPLTGGVTTRQPPAASLTLSSLAVIVTRTANVNVVPPAGLLTLSQAAPVLTYNFNFTVPKADLTLNEAAPIASVGISRQPLKGGLTLSTAAPIVAVTTHRFITVPFAELSISSEQVSVVLSKHLLLTPASDTLELFGYRPRVTVSANDLPFIAIKGRYLRRQSDRVRMLQSADQRTRDLKSPVRRPRELVRLGRELEEV